MLHLPLSVMNRLHQTESAVFKLDAVFPKDLLSDYLETTITVVVPCGSPKKSPVDRYSVVIFTFSGLLGP